MPIQIKRRLFACALTLIASGCLEDNKKAYKELELKNTRLQTQLDGLALQLDSVLNEQKATRTDLLNEGDISFLRSRGLANPAEAIKSDLIKNRALIPLEGSLGGTMQFYKERIYVLNRQWVLAYFEDGHNAGEMLLEYKVSSKGNISWKAITSSIM